LRIRVQLACEPHDLIAQLQVERIHDLRAIEGHDRDALVDFEPGHLLRFTCAHENSDRFRDLGLCYAERYDRRMMTTHKLVQTAERTARGELP
jgi:hypothetical protein